MKYSSGKKCFTKKEALGAINATYKNNRTNGWRRQRRNRPDNLRAYHCPDCNFHHLSSH